MKDWIQSLITIAFVIVSTITSVIITINVQISKLNAISEAAAKDRELIRQEIKDSAEAAAKDRELIRQEIKDSAEAAAKDRELIRQEIKDSAEAAAKDRELIRKEMSRLADQVDRLNQNYINHLSFHQGLAPKTPQQ